MDPPLFIDTNCHRKDVKLLVQCIASHPRDQTSVPLAHNIGCANQDNFYDQNCSCQLTSTIIMMIPDP